MCNMAFIQREMSGSLFPNDRKEKETQPDFKGECLIDGVTYEIGAWEKEAKTGRKFTSLSFKVKSATYNLSKTYPPDEIQPDRRAPPPAAESDLPF